MPGGNRERECTTSPVFFPLFSCTFFASLLTYTNFRDYTQGGLEWRVRHECA